MENQLVYTDATKLAELIRSRKVSSVEVVQAYLDRIEAVDPQVNAIVTVVDNALAHAKAADAAIRSGEQLGPLHGVPFTVKDSIDTAGVPTQRGSPIFKGRTPDIDATSVARMKAAGGILLAKTNLPEFSYYIESNNLLSGRTNNPWNLDRTPGGSSGGESAAIAAGMSPLGLGTDLAISVRGPASQTGITSIKPTYGRIPMTGVWPRVPRRFWHVGPMARSVGDIELAYSLLLGPDGADGFSSSTVQFDAGVGPSPTRPLRIGWLVGPGFGPIDPEVVATVKTAADAFASVGCPVDTIGIPALEQDFPLDVFNRLHVMEMKPAFAEVIAGYSDDEIFMMARTMLEMPDTSMKDYIEAEQGAERIRDGFAEVFQRVDVLLTPVQPIPAQKHGTEEFHIDGQTVDPTYLQGSTVPLNITGLPGVSMRFGMSSDGMPIGIQLIAQWNAETTLFYAGKLLEGLSAVHGLWPSL